MGARICRLASVPAALALFGMALAATAPAASAGTVFSQSFDGVTAPALPAGWTVSGTPAWLTKTSFPDTPPNAAASPGPPPTSAGQTSLVSPVIPVAGPATLSFRQRVDTETPCYDGGVLEIKIGSGPFTDIVAAGGNLVTGAYNGTIATGSSNPLATKPGWCGFPLSGAYFTTQATLPTAAIGTNVQLRWRFAWDIGNAACSNPCSGWRVDTISLNIADAPVTTNCTTTIQGVFVANYTVSSGTTCFKNSALDGSITVNPGAALSLIHTAVSGNITTNSATGLTICDSQIGGGLSVYSSTGFVLIGDGGDGPAPPTDCKGNKIGGQVILGGSSGTGNVAGVELGGTELHNNVIVSWNVPSASAPTEDNGTELEGNTITGSLICQSNNPAPTNDGNPNSVSGTRAGQTCSSPTF